MERIVLFPETSSRLPNYILTNVNRRDLACEKWTHELYGRLVELAERENFSITDSVNRKAVAIVEEYRHYELLRTFARGFISSIARSNCSFEDFVENLAIKIHFSQKHHNRRLGHFFEITSNIGESIL